LLKTGRYNIGHISVDTPGKYNKKDVGKIIGYIVERFMWGEDYFNCKRLQKIV